jgi:hypothetical protein
MESNILLKLSSVNSRVFINQTLIKTKYLIVENTFGEKSSSIYLTDITLLDDKKTSHMIYYMNSNIKIQNMKTSSNKTFDQYITGEQMESPLMITSELKISDLTSELITKVGVFYFVIANVAFAHFMVFHVFSQYLENNFLYFYIENLVYVLFLIKNEIYRLSNARYYYFYDFFIFFYIFCTIFFYLCFLVMSIIVQNCFRKQTSVYYDSDVLYNFCIKTSKNQKARKYQSYYSMNIFFLPSSYARSFFLLSLKIYYFILMKLVDSYTCEDIQDKFVYVADKSIYCYEPSFMVEKYFYIGVFVLLTLFFIGFLMASFFSKKNFEKNLDLNFSFGNIMIPFYRIYKKNRLFFSVIDILRYF